MKRILLILAMLLLLLIGNVYATDTVTMSDTENIKVTNQSTKAIREISWTVSSDDGTVAVVTAAHKFANDVSGNIISYTYIPDGTNTPDTGTDIVIYAGDLAEAILKLTENI